jgi:CIC family chloride channel protein
MAQEEAEKYGIPETSILRIGYNAAKAILETAREHHCQLILLGWKGFSSTTDKILGRVTDAVVTHARSDILLVKLSNRRKIHNVLLPTAGGEHARAAETYAADLVKSINGKLTLCRIQDPESKGQGIPELTKNDLAAAKERIKAYNGLEADDLIVYNSSISKGILTVAKQFDTVIVGATRDSIYQQILFGSIPESLAKVSKTNVIMVKHHHPVKALLGRVMSDQ